MHFDTVQSTNHVEYTIYPHGRGGELELQEKKDSRVHRLQPREAGNKVKITTNKFKIEGDQLHLINKNAFYDETKRNNVGTYYGSKF